jgi:hypothetical protein
MQTGRIRSVLVTVCCAATLAGGSGGSIVATVANGNLSVPSTYVCPVKTSEADCELNEGASVTVVPDAARFRLLADDWRHRTRHESSISRAILDPSHIKIVRMDKEVVLPLIFAELRERGGHWYWALYTLTDETIGDRGDSLATVKAKWLEWGREHGYLRA